MAIFFLASTNNSNDGCFFVNRMIRRRERFTTRPGKLINENRTAFIRFGCHASRDELSAMSWNDFRGDLDVFAVLFLVGHFDDSVDAAPSYPRATRIPEVASDAMLEHLSGIGYAGGDD